MQSPTIPALPIFRLLLTGFAVAFASVPSLAGGRHHTSSEGDEFGRTYYIDGAGNWGFGVSEVTNGLRRAGYRGRVINWPGSPTLSPALDQTVGRPFAKSRGKAMGREITEYLQSHPGREVNIIALSAGTGVAIWACETVTPPAKLHNVVLLGSSLSSDYDASEALEHINGGIWVYYSHGDGILLGPVRAFGTIDGKMGVDGAGLVGLHPRSGASDRIHNIAWDSSYARFGWTGTHTDGTSEPFVRNVLSRHILEPAAAETASASPRSAGSAEASNRPSTQAAGDGATVRPVRFAGQ